MKNILWDFDGVILDSMEVRSWGFRQIFKKYPKELVDKLIEYHLTNGGLSRYVKIRYMYEQLLDKSISEEKVNDYANQFSSLMKKELTNPDNLIDDSVNYIKQNHKKFKFHIVSGSDQTELRFLCKELNIDSYFLSIGGSPTPKKQLVKDLLTNLKYNKNQTCLIGDSINDFEAANENKITFYGYNNISLKACSKEYINDFKSFSI